VAVVVDRVSDVVQQGGVLEQLAARRRQAERGCEPVEERRRQLGHVPPMLIVARPATGERDDRTAAPEPRAGTDAVGPGELEQHPFAQRPAADRQVGDACPGHDGVKQHGRGRHQVDALRVHAREVGARARVGREETAAERVDLLARRERTVQAPGVLAARRPGHPDERIDGARRPDRRDHPPPPRPIEQVADRACDVALERAHLPAGRRVLREKPLGEPCDPERNAPHPERLAVLDERQLDAAAADVDQQVGATLERHRVAHGAEDETRLVEARDDLDRQARLALQPPHEGRAVARFTDGAGRHRAQPVHVTGAGEASERGHGTRGELGRLGGERAGREGFPPEADHLLHAVDDHDTAVGRHVGDDHVDGVRAEVQGGQPHSSHCTDSIAGCHVKRSRVRSIAWQVHSRPTTSARSSNRSSSTTAVAKSSSAMPVDAKKNVRGSSTRVRPSAGRTY
jgi:hypothetical protein